MSCSFLVICNGGRNLSIFVVGNWLYFWDIDNIWRTSDKFEQDKGKLVSEDCGKVYLVPWSLYLLLIFHKYLLYWTSCFVFGKKASSVFSRTLSYFVAIIGYWEAYFLEIVAFLPFPIFFPEKHSNNLKIFTVIIHHHQK